MTTNIIDLATHRNMRNRIKPVHVNLDICALVAETTPHVVGESGEVFVERIVRAYLEGVR